MLIILIPKTVNWFARQTHSQKQIKVNWTQSVRYIFSSYPLVNPGPISKTISASDGPI